jgi:hypothetical protein
LPRRARLPVFVTVLAVAALVAVTNGRADGDPASDVLLSAPVFLPYDPAAVSVGAQQALITTVDRAKRAGYPIKVALIAQPYDLGAVASLWGKPRQYANFLAIELSFVYKGPLLIVMPAGLGFAHTKHPTTSEYRVLAALSRPSGRDGLATAAVRAVAALAARAGHPITPAVTASPVTGDTTTRDRLLAGGLALALAASGMVLVVLRRRRHNE